jgi:hypothetical protein
MACPVGAVTEELEMPAYVPHTTVLIMHLTKDIDHLLSLASSQPVRLPHSLDKSLKCAVGSVDKNNITADGLKPNQTKQANKKLLFLFQISLN